MSLLEPSTTLADLGLPFPEMLLEQAFCVPVGDEQFQGWESLGDLAQRFGISWTQMVQTMNEILIARAAIKDVDAEEPVGDCFIFDLSYTKPDLAPAPLRMEVLLQGPKNRKVLIQGGHQKDRFSAALYLAQLGFTNVNYQVENNGST